MAAARESLNARYYIWGAQKVAIVQYLRECIKKYLALHSRRLSLDQKKSEIKKFRWDAHRRFSDDRLQVEDRSQGYNLREEAVNLMYFYLCPAKARSFTAAEFIDDVCQFAGATWSSECWDYRSYSLRLVQLYNNEVALSDSDNE
ncbi:hypothetical protein R1sor_019905 [Riccia sorocarpa]|uniref:Uncharacterized protein n=1 Tax=Riccia sorocarpa TaxID=122646 RepID=A0ABD3IDY2_9MARC